MSNDDKTALPAFPWDGRNPANKFSAYYFCLESTGDPGVDSVLMAVAFAGKMSHRTEAWSDADVSGRTLEGWIQHAAELAAAAHRDEVERLRAEAEELRSEAEQAVQAIERWMPLTDSLPVAVNKMVDEIKLLRRRCDMRDRSAAQWSEAAKREAPTPEALERARGRFVECKIQQEEAPPGSIMRRVCDAAMELADLLEQRETTMKARVVELALEAERLRAEAEGLRERLAEAKLLLTDGVAMVGRLRAGLRDAFDAGARAAVAEIHGGDDLPANMDITKLPGRPEVRP